MNLKGREDQNGAKPSEVQRLHTRKHEKGRWRVQIKRFSTIDHEVGPADP